MNEQNNQLGQTNQPERDQQPVDSQAVPSNQPAGQNAVPATEQANQGQVNFQQQANDQPEQVNYQQQQPNYQQVNYQQQANYQQTQANYQQQQPNYQQVNYQQQAKRPLVEKHDANAVAQVLKRSFSKNPVKAFEITLNPVISAIIIAINLIVSSLVLSLISKGVFSGSAAKLARIGQAISGEGQGFSAGIAGAVSGQLNALYPVFINFLIYFALSLLVTGLGVGFLLLISSVGKAVKFDLKFVLSVYACATILPIAMGLINIIFTLLYAPLGLIIAILTGLTQLYLLFAATQVIAKSRKLSYFWLFIAYTALCLILIVVFCLGIIPGVSIKRIARSAMENISSGGFDLGDLFN